MMRMSKIGLLSTLFMIAARLIVEARNEKIQTKLDIVVVILGTDFYKKAGDRGIAWNATIQLGDHFVISENHSRVAVVDTDTMGNGVVLYNFTADDRVVRNWKLPTPDGKMILGGIRGPVETLRQYVLPKARPGVPKVVLFMTFGYGEPTNVSKPEMEELEAMKLETAGLVYATTNTADNVSSDNHSAVRHIGDASLVFSIDDVHGLAKKIGEDAAKSAKTDPPTTTTSSRGPSSSTKTDESKRSTIETKPETTSKAASSSSSKIADSSKSAESSSTTAAESNASSIETNPPSAVSSVVSASSTNASESSLTDSSLSPTIAESKPSSIGHQSTTSEASMVESTTGDAAAERQRLANQQDKKEKSNLALILGVVLGVVACIVIAVIVAVIVVKKRKGKVPKATKGKATPGDVSLFYKPPVAGHADASIEVSLTESPSIKRELPKKSPSSKKDADSKKVVSTSASPKNAFDVKK